MTAKLIALVDGSGYSASVCQHAAWVSRRTSTPVELLHVLGRREAVGNADLSGTIRLGARTALLEELAALDEQRAKLMAHRGRAILEDARALVEAAGVTAVTARLRHGDIVETVGEVEADATMIVIGKRGDAADFAKGHLGSNLERIVRATRKPVLVAARAFRPVEKVLVAYDGGASANGAVARIAEDQLFSGLSIRLVTVGQANAPVEKALHAAQARLHEAGLAAEAAIVSGQPDVALSRIIDDERFDMLVMGAYGHSRVRNLIIGSTTTAMVRSCRVPVLLVR